MIFSSVSGTNCPSLCQRLPPLLLYMFCPGLLWVFRCSLYRAPCWKESRGWNLANAFLPSVPAQICAYLEKGTLSNLHQNAIQASHSSASRFWGEFCSISYFLSLWQGHVSWFSRSFPPTYKHAFIQKPQQKFWVFLAFCHVPSPYRLWAHMCILKSEMIL